MAVFEENLGRLFILMAEKVFCQPELLGLRHNLLVISPSVLAVNICWHIDL